MRRIFSVISLIFLAATSSYASCGSSVVAPFRFALLTDIHISSVNPTPLEDLRRSVDDINGQDSLAFVLVSGDITEAGDLRSMELAKTEAEHKPAVVYGRDLVTGLPVERSIPTDLIDATISETASVIVDNIKVILERTPPELSADIYKRGIYLTGGTASLAHIDELIVKGTALKVNKAENPQESVAYGLARIIKDPNFRSVAYSLADMSEDV